MMEIGGYFELELQHKESYYPGFLQLNSGRSCLEYILLSGGYTKLYLPIYICDVVLEPINRFKVNVEYYKINDDFTIKHGIILKDSEAILYVNYFGLMDDYIIQLSNKYSNLIVDNAQAFFSKPIDSAYTYYSPRKFFGVSDGGYLKTNSFISIDLEQDLSCQSANFLLQRLDIGPEQGYLGFRENEERISLSGLKKMSKLTRNILSNIDYEFVKQKREENFKFLCKELKAYNNLNIISDETNGPMVYPFLSTRSGLRDFLITNKIFVARYWDSTKLRLPKSSFEENLSSNLVALPVDQRYGEIEMRHIVNLVKSYFNK